MKEFSPFRLDPVNQCLWRRTGAGMEERVLLTPTEYGVLAYLVTHAHRLVSHRELLDAVWPGTAIEPQAVKSNIFRLRRLLEDDPRRPRYIETLSRRGYRFVGILAPDMAEGDRPAALTSRLVGRENALSELLQCASAASTGTLQMVFVTGEPGIGKTALVEEFQRQLAPASPAPRVLWGQCLEGFGSKEAFYPVLEALGPLARAPDQEFVQMLASRAPTWLVQFPDLLTPQHRETLRQEILGATRERMLREVCQALETMAAARPLLLLLEDLHWADASTLDLISALARRRVPARIMVVATYPSDVAGSAQPLHSLKRDLVARQLCREIVLQPLTEAEIARYLGSSPGGQPPDELAALLHRHTEGNPLFMKAVLQDLVGRGMAERDGDAWRLRTPTAEIVLEVPETLRQMIGAQIDRLDGPEQRVLEVAAIAGMSFAPALSAPTADLDPGVFEACCGALARRGHILRLGGTQELPDGRIVQRYGFTHALYREVLYERQAPAQRATLHRRRAERLEAVFTDALDEVTPELAHHFEKGAEPGRAVKYLRRAAELAVRRYALEEARTNLQHALSLAEHLPAGDRPATEIAILDTLGGMDVVTSDVRAVPTLSLLRDRAAAYGLPDVEAEALVDLVLPISRTSAEHALEVIDQALQLSDARLDPLMRARIRAGCMMRRIATRGWNAEDATQCRRALDDIRRHGTRNDVAWHVLDCSFVDFYSSRYRKAQRDVLDALAMLTEGHAESFYLDYAVAHWSCEVIVSWSHNLLGEWGAALREIDTRLARAERNSDLYRQHLLLLARAWVLLNAADFAGARAITDALLPELHHPVQASVRRFCLVVGGAAEVGAGQHAAGLAHLTAAREEMDRQMVLVDWYRRLMLQWALANLWLARGDLTRASAEGDRFLTESAATAERTWQALAWETNARIALASGHLELAQDRIEKGLSALDGVEAPVAAWQACATAADVSGALGDAAAARAHRGRSREVILELAASLESHEQLRRTFLTAPAVARVLGEEPARDVAGVGS
jgi:DNA-binding winged helix-turn-helix (wHTH) protein